jgi:hypothetical protein
MCVCTYVYIIGAFCRFISFWIECSIILSSCVACLSSCLVVTAELVSSRRLFREDLSLEDDTLGFVVLAVAEGSSISSFSSSSFPGDALSCSSSTTGTSS